MPDKVKEECWECGAPCVVAVTDDAYRTPRYTYSPDEAPVFTEEEKEWVQEVVDDVQSGYYEHPVLKVLAAKIESILARPSKGDVKE